MLFSSGDHVILRAAINALPDSIEAPWVHISGMINEHIKYVAEHLAIYYDQLLEEGMTEQEVKQYLLRHTKLFWHSQKNLFSVEVEMP